MSIIVSKKKKIALACIAVAVWSLAHIPGILYGTQDVPLHQSYIGDEQSSVNGALHMLESHSILGFRNVKTFYYGPLFALIDTPAILADFGTKYAAGLVHSAAGYENYILYDWGGIVFGLHVTATLASLLGLYAAYLFLKTRTMNPAGKRWLPYLSTALIAVNFYFFEYSHFAKHWAFIIPLIFVQLYSFVRIGETEEQGKGQAKKYWLIHSAATVAIFGISYVGVLSLAMWLPWLVRAAARRDFPSIKRFVLYGLLMLAGFIVMFAWDPYPFIHDISFLGVGAPQGGMSTTQNPLFFAHNSILWYGTEIVLNDLALAAAFILLVIVLWPKKIGRSPMLWSLVLPAAVFFFFFALAEHHEGRYMLPTIVLLILAFGYLLSEYVAADRFRQDKTPLVRTALVTLVCAYAVFQISVDAEWMNVYARGPIEKQGIAEILRLQKTGAPVLVIQSYLLGQAHDKASYAAYIAERGREDTDLYQAIMAADPPAGMPLLDVRYASEAQFAARPAITEGWAHAVWDYVPIPGLINQFDYFDFDAMRLFYYDALSPRYIILK